MISKPDWDLTKQKLYEEYKESIDTINKQIEKHIGLRFYRAAGYS